MSRYCWGVICLVIRLSMGVQADTALESFKREAEAALRLRVDIMESVTGLALGQTFCGMDAVLIQIGAGLDGPLRDQVLAHELGHALLCARGVRTIASLTSAGIQQDSGGLVTEFRNVVASCYIDPLADAEAERRGFETSRTVDELARKMTSHRPEEIQKSVNRYGELWGNYVAAILYCADLRHHSFRMKAVERFFSVEPSISKKIRDYRRALGTPRCRDALTCFTLTKRLRDAAGLKGLVVIQNPESHSFE